MGCRKETPVDLPCYVVLPLFGLMHILYLDDSGSVENPEERHFVLGRIAIFERGIYHQIAAADKCVAAFGLGDPVDIELHGSPMYAGRDAVWRTVRDRPRREQMIREALGVFSSAASVRLFAIPVDKAAVGPQDPIQLAFEEVCNRFNLLLQGINNRRPQESHRGHIVMDEIKYERPLQALARNFRSNGGRWDHFRNLAEVPLFVDSSVPLSAIG
jgi:uncharacterized protein DUF3800